MAGSPFGRLRFQFIALLIHGQDDLLRIAFAYFFATLFVGISFLAAWALDVFATELPLPEVLAAEALDVLGVAGVFGALALDALDGLATRTPDGLATRPLLL